MPRIFYFPLMFTDEKPVVIRSPGVPEEDGFVLIPHQDAAHLTPTIRKDRYRLLEEIANKITFLCKDKKIRIGGNEAEACAIANENEQVGGKPVLIIGLSLELFSDSDNKDYDPNDNDNREANKYYIRKKILPVQIVSIRTMEYFEYSPDSQGENLFYADFIESYWPMGYVFRFYPMSSYSSKIDHILAPSDPPPMLSSKQSLRTKAYPATPKEDKQPSLSASMPAFPTQQRKQTVPVKSKSLLPNLPPEPEKRVILVQELRAETQRRAQSTRFFGIPNKNNKPIDLSLSSNPSGKKGGPS